MAEIGNFVFWASYALLPLLAGLLYLVLSGPVWRRLLAVVFLVPVGLLVYARFVEPQRFVRAYTDVEICGRGLPGTLTVAVLADQHIGDFPNAISPARAVRAINKSEVDLTLIAGDFTYNLDPSKFDKAFAAYTDLDAPAYAVMGNHDHEHGEEYTEKLVSSLERQGLTVLAPGEDIFRKSGKMLRIVGLRDYQYAWHKELPVGDLPEPGGMPVIAIAHNPNTVRARNLGYYDLMVAGHTHGGQILLPKLTCKMTGACNTLIYGLGETPTGKLFVTSGTGMVDLPMRFRAVPRVDILRLTINRCETLPFNDTVRIFPHFEEE